MSGPAFTARVARWKALVGLLISGSILAYLLLTPGYGARIGIGGLPGVAVGALELLGIHAADPVLLVLGDAVLVLVVLGFVWRFVTGGIRVRIDARGIFDRDFFDTFIGWDEIERAWVEQRSRGSNPQLYLTLREGRPWRARMPMRLVWRLSGAKRRREVMISTQGLNRDLVALLDAVEQFRPGLIER